MVTIREENSRMLKECTGNLEEIVELRREHRELSEKEIEWETSVSRLIGECNTLWEQVRNTKEEGGTHREEKHASQRKVTLQDVKIFTQERKIQTLRETLATLRETNVQLFVVKSVLAIDVAKAHLFDEYLEKVKGEAKPGILLKIAQRLAARIEEQVSSLQNNQETMGGMLRFLQKAGKEEETTTLVPSIGEGIGEGQEEETDFGYGSPVSGIMSFQQNDQRQTWGLVNPLNEKEVEMSLDAVGKPEDKITVGTPGQ